MGLAGQTSQPKPMYKYALWGGDRDTCTWVHMYLCLVGVQEGGRHHGLEALGGGTVHHDVEERGSPGLDHVIAAETGQGTGTERTATLTVERRNQSLKMSKFEL